MKKILFALLLVLCCACEEDKSVDPTLMPEATTTGENTLGCVIDGWVYTAGRYGKPKVSIAEEEGSSYVTISANVGASSYLSFTLVNPRQGSSCTYVNARFDDVTLEDGEANITRMTSTIISGTFSGLEIRDGRFDLKHSFNDDDSHSGDIF